MNETDKSAQIQTVPECPEGYGQRVLHIVKTFLPAYVEAAKTFDAKDFAVQLIASEGERYLNPKNSEEVEVPEGLACVTLIYKEVAKKVQFYNKVDEIRKRESTVASVKNCI